MANAAPSLSHGDKLLAFVVSPRFDSKSGLVELRSKSASECIHYAMVGTFFNFLLDCSGQHVLLFQLVFMQQLHGSVVVRQKLYLSHSSVLE